MSSSLTCKEPWSFLNMSLRARIMPFPEDDLCFDSSAYQQRILPLSRITLYISRKICDMFSDASMFLKCCENLNLKQDSFAINTIMVIDLCIKRLQVEMIMPAYAVFILEHHAYCLVATKLLMKSLKTHSIDLINHLQAFENDE